MTQSCKISLASKTKQRQLYYAVLLCSDINRNKKRCTADMDSKVYRFECRPFVRVKNEMPLLS